ncbi:MAG: NDP-sugar synthase [Vicinamibacterales bacterium]
MIPAIVLTAGLATRLRPLSLVRAKAALPVAGQPLVTHILGRLARAGVTEAVLNLHHLPATLTSRLGDGTDLGIRLRYSWEAPQVLGSAGGPRKALSLLDTTTALIVNGDTLTDVDIAALLDDHRRSGALVTMAVVPNTRPDRYSGLAADAAGNFIGVVARGASTPSFHFVGVQVVEAAAFASLDEGTPADVLKGLYQALVQQRPDAVRIRVCDTPFLDIGTAEDYVSTCRAMGSTDGLVECGVRTRIDPRAQLQDVIVWDDVDIGPDTSLRHVVVTDGVRVPAGSRWSDVILRPANGEPDRDEQVLGNLFVSALQQS